MAGIFDVGVGEMMGSNVTPQQPTSKTSSLEVFSQAGAQIVTTAAQSYAKAAKQGREDATNTVLSNFSRKMAAIADDTIINGTSPERAMMQARRLYSQAMASHPYLSEDIDKSFNSFFSGPLGNAATKGSEQYQAENKLISGAADWISPGMDRDQQLKVARLKAQNAVWKEANQNLKLEREMLDLDSKQSLTGMRVTTEQLRQKDLQNRIKKQGYELQSIQVVEAQDKNYYSNGFQAKVKDWKDRIGAGEANTPEGKAKIRLEMSDVQSSILSEINHQGAFMSPTSRDALMTKYTESLKMVDSAIDNPLLVTTMKEDIDKLNTTETWKMNQSPKFRQLSAMSKTFRNTDIMTLAGNEVANEMLEDVFGKRPVNTLSKEGKSGVSAIHKGYIQPNLRLINAGQGYKTPEELKLAKQEVADHLSTIMMGTNAYSDSIEDKDKSTSNYAAVLDLMSDPEVQKFVQDNRTIFPAKVVNKFQQTIEAEYTNRNYGIINAKLDGISMHTDQGGFQLATRGPQFTYNLREDVEPVLAGSTIKFVAKKGKSVRWEVLESLNTQLGNRLNRIMGIDRAFSGDSYDKIFSTRIAPQIGYGKESVEEAKP